MREGKICALAWKDVHLNKGYLDVTQAIGRNNGKPYLKSPKNNKSKRLIPIIDELSRYLKDRLKYACFKEGVDESEPHWFVVGERDKFKNPYSDKYIAEVHDLRNKTAGTERKRIGE